MQDIAPGFPAVDPIALPAPVWIFKALHDLTLTLHFGALFLMLGGLAIGIVWNVLGHLQQHRPMISASGVLAARLPIVMTFVINLGVPPLLFSQVLYGRALYTSSVLIGVWWISVVFLVILGYFLLYRANKLAMAAQSWWLWGLLSIGALVVVARIYSTNMTLMLRPDVWQGMYESSSIGLSTVPFDPTLTPRWLFMLVAALGFGALGCVCFSIGKLLDHGTRRFLARWGGRCAVGCLIAVGFLSVWAWVAQAENVRAGVLDSWFHRIAIGGWWLGLTIAVIVAFLAFRRADKPVPIAIVPALAGGLLALGSMVVVRDGIRDITLQAAGFDVWQRTVETNWVVLGLFLVLFVVGIAFLAWLGSVVKRASPVEENYVNA